MQLNELFGDRKSEPEPAMRASCDYLGLTEPVEYMRKELALDSYARIRNADLHDIFVPYRCHIDTSAARRKLDCVRQEVPHDLLDSVRIGAYDADVLA